jgi:hypothetical protein
MRSGKVFGEKNLTSACIICLIPYHEELRGELSPCLKSEQTWKKLGDPIETLNQVMCNMRKKSTLCFGLVRVFCLFVFVLGGFFVFVFVFFLVVGRSGEFFATVHIAAALKTFKKLLKKEKKGKHFKKKINSYTLFSMCG